MTDLENRLFELAARRRSIRRYTGTPIREDILDGILKTALTAPSSFGHQPVEFAVVRNRQMISELASCKRMGGSQIIGADTVIIVMVRLDQGEFWIEDGAVASAYILLAAEQYDIGACWVQIRNWNGKQRTSDEEIRELLHVPEGYAVLNLIALGEKGEEKPGYTEADLDRSRVHYETF